MATFWICGNTSCSEYREEKLYDNPTNCPTCGNPQKDATPILIKLKEMDRSRFRNGIKARDLER